MKKKINLLKTLTILTFIISMFIYEIGICNISNIGISYNFSLCRIVLYLIFLILLIKNIDKFLQNVVQYFKYKKIILIIYAIIAIVALVYVILEWNSVYKILSLMIALLMGILVIIYISDDYVKNAIVIISTLGILFTFNTNFHHCLDEKTHSMSAINLANGNFNYIENQLNEPAFNNIIFSCDIDQYAQFWSVKYEPNLTEDWGNSKDDAVYYMCSAPTNYNFILYIPSALGIKFASILGGSIADVYITGRLFNLLAYEALLVLILKILPYKKKIFSMIYMLPISLLLAASYSIDGLCLGIIGIFIAYCLYLSENYEKVKIKQICIMILTFAMCLLVKNLAYFAIIIFAFVMPVLKILKNNKKQLPIITTIITITIVLCITFLFLRLGQATSEETGDIRGGETSVTGQIEFLLSSPMNIIKIGFEHIINTLLNYDWYANLNQYEFFGKYYKQIFFLEMIFLIYVSITDNTSRASKRVIIVSILTFLAVFGTTSMMLYLQFSPVGQIGISGYQARYILPILPIALMTLNKKSNAKNNEVNIALASGAIVFVNLICLIYKI